jgi:hypothetical protein
MIRIGSAVSKRNAGRGIERQQLKWLLFAAAITSSSSASEGTEFARSTY